MTTWTPEQKRTASNAMPVSFARRLLSPRLSKASAARASRRCTLATWWLGASVLRASRSHGTAKFWAEMQAARASLGGRGMSRRDCRRVMSRGGAERPADGWATWPRTLATEANSGPMSCAMNPSFLRWTRGSSGWVPWVDCAWVGSARDTSRSPLGAPSSPGNRPARAN